MQNDFASELKRMVMHDYSLEYAFGGGVLSDVRIETRQGASDVRQQEITHTSAYRVPVNSLNAPAERRQTLCKR